MTWAGDGTAPVPVGRPADLIRTLYDAALAAVQPDACVARTLVRDRSGLWLGGRSWPVTGRVWVVGAGKAATGMARAVEAVCGDLVTGGLVITKDGHASPPLPATVRVVEASHPLPDARGIAATAEVLAMLASSGPADLVVAVISGGGSALLEAPVDGVSIEDLVTTTDLLLRAGAPIEALNQVRRPLSRVKGGGLRRAAGPATTLTLVLSDVIGNDPDTIASGPTVVAAAPPAAALETLARYGLLGRVPVAVLSALERRIDESGERGRGSDVGLGPAAYVVIGDNDTALDAATGTARAAGYRTETIWRGRSGEAGDLAREWVAACHSAPVDVDLLIGGGEATVTVRGDGVGGRNTEFAVAAALAMEEHGPSGWTIASLATDGQDGPTGVAGGIVDGQTVARAVAAGVDVRAALATNDTLRVLEAAGGAVAPGPTGTNVNDLYVGVRVR